MCSQSSRQDAFGSATCHLSQALNGFCCRQRQGRGWIFVLLISSPSILCLATEGQGSSGRNIGTLIIPAKNTALRPIQPVAVGPNDRVSTHWLHSGPGTACNCSGQCYYSVWEGEARDCSCLPSSACMRCCIPTCWLISHERGLYCTEQLLGLAGRAEERVWVPHLHQAWQLNSTHACADTPCASTLLLLQIQHQRRACRVVQASSPLREPPQQQRTDSSGRKLTAMPKLPERPPKRQKSSGSSSKRSSSPQPSPRRSPTQGRKAPLMLPPVLPPEQQQHAQERTLAGLLAYSGLLGTLASGVSMVCPGVDLFGGFSLSSPADLASCVLGLQLLLPCCLLTLGIMLPDYSSWKVPAEPTLEAQQKMAESLLAWTANKKAAAEAAAAAASTASGGSPAAAAAAAGQGDAAASSPSATATAAASESAAASSSSSADGASSTQAREAASSSAQPELLLPPPTAGSPPGWMINNPDPPLPFPLARCKDALLMAQVRQHRIQSSVRLLHSLSQPSCMAWHALRATCANTQGSVCWHVCTPLTLLC